MTTPRELIAQWRTYAADYGRLGEGEAEAAVDACADDLEAALAAADKLVTMECSPELVAILTEQWSDPVRVKIDGGKFVSERYAAPSLLTDEEREALEQAVAMPVGTMSERGLRSNAVMTACLDIGFWLLNTEEVARYLLAADARLRGAE